MAQILTLPLNNMMLTAGYKNPAYKKAWTWEHYGVDATDPSSRNIYGMGNGKVVAAGQDGETLTGENSRLGNVVVVVYPEVELTNGKVQDVTCRMYHLDKISVKVGDAVTAKTVLGQYGNTGANTTGAHLHIEFDADTKWPTLAPGVKVGANRVINRAEDVKKAGGLADSTIAPNLVYCIGIGQKIGTKYLGTWVLDADADLEKAPAGESKDEEIARLRATITQYEIERNKILYYIEELAKAAGLDGN